MVCLYNMYVKLSLCWNRGSYGVKHSVNTYTIIAVIQNSLTANYANLKKIISHFRDALSLCFKVRRSAKLLTWNVFFSFSCKENSFLNKKVSHLLSFWEWECLELRNGRLVILRLRVDWHGLELHYGNCFEGVCLMVVGRGSWVWVKVVGVGNH